MIKSTEVEVYAVEEVLICDACGDEEMVYDRTTPTFLASYPAQYVHTCGKCEGVAITTTIYPRIDIRTRGIVND